MPTSSTFSRSPAPSAFTLVELLVVIAVVGLLLGLLVPALAATAFFRVLAGGPC